MQTTLTSHGLYLLPVMGLLLPSLLLFTLRLPLQLVRPAYSDILWPEIAEQRLEHILNEPASRVIDNHQNSQCQFKLGAERDQAELLVQFRHEFGCTRKGDTRCRNQTPVHSLILANGLSEGAALVVDRESRNLLDKLQKIDGAVEERRLKVSLQINVGLSPATESVINTTGPIPKQMETHGSMLYT